MRFSDLSSVIGEIVAVQAEPYLTTGQTAASADPGTAASPVCDSAKPIFVPVAFSLEEALHVLGAVRSVFHATAIMGEAKKAAPLAQAMMRLAEATDKAQEAA